VHVHGAVLIESGHATFGNLVEAAFDRGLWLLEGLGGKGGFPKDEVAAVAILRDAARRRARNEDPPLQIDVARARSVFERRIGDTSAPPAIRGACLGAIVGLPNADLNGHAALSTIKRTPPAELGDLLAGLFALARSEMLAEPDLVRTVDALVGLLGEEDFLATLPSLRFAFTWFPPMERAAIADRVAALYGRGSQDARQLLREVAAPEAIALAKGIERDAASIARRVGLTDELDEEGA
jgi:hypothetical protein